MFVVFLFFASFLSTTLAATPPNVHCLNRPGQRLDPADCADLLTQLAEATATHALITYGVNEPPPGNIPNYLGYRSCSLELKAAPYRGTYIEKIRLIDYIGPIQEIYTKCLNPPHGYKYNGGTVFIGVNDRFYALLGAGERHGKNSNDTVDALL